MAETKVRIKICGLSRMEDIDAVNEARPDYCGFIINFPKSIRNVTPLQVRHLRQRLRPEIVPVGVFVDQPLELVEELLRDKTIAAAQLHGNESEAYIRQLKESGGYTVIKALNETSFARARSCAADFLLLDHGRGGTGKTFSWEMARQIDRPYFLAGGIGEENLEEALSLLHPWAVDVSSKVETDGKKDREKIRRMVGAVRLWNARQAAGAKDRPQPVCLQQ